ncbi:MAG: DNA polymerase III subunit beta [Clostridia bacterium]|nr:DNA polymerase III subunit beta [Clostridia bacterium]MBQ8371241.1 DNA polymerase III subunit beta [Clostridia bacterium]MBQ8513144.1 DNA polymerase III subunit beta [Clostridia bacterium]
MRVTFDKQELLAAITPAAAISQTKNTFASVDGLLFECPPNPKFGDYDTDQPNLCRISAFDLEKGLRTSVPCTIEDKGMAVLNTVKISQIVRALPDGEVTIDINERGRAAVSGGSFCFEITASPGSDFPAMPMFIGERTYKIPQHALISLIRRTVYAVAQNDPRAAFNGALFRIRDGKLSAVGSDGFRFSVSVTDLTTDNETVPDAELIIPGKFLTELLRLLDDSEDTCTMMLGRKHVIFHIGTLWFFTRTLDTEYIPFEQFLPSSAKTEVIVRADELRNAVELASIVTEDKLGGSGKSHIKLDFADRKIALSSVSSGGSVSGSVAAQITGQEISIAFTCRYLLEALKAVPESCETIRIRLNTPSAGVTVDSPEHPEFLYFILPWIMRK